MAVQNDVSPVGRRGGVSVAKRALDLAICGPALVLLAPLMAGLALVIRLVDGAPVLYVSERMGGTDHGFALLKFRTMTQGGEAGGVTGADKQARITALGSRLRTLRLDELPQLGNVLRGELSLVGPRPPLRVYVEARPDLYAAVLSMRPGITGLATLVYHRHEAQLLAGCATPEETHATYLRRCVPRKAALDLIYRRHASVGFDLWILWQTLRALAGAGSALPHPKRAMRMQKNRPADHGRRKSADTSQRL